MDMYRILNYDCDHNYCFARSLILWKTVDIQKLTQQPKLRLCTNVPLKETLPKGKYYLLRKQISL